MWIKSQLITTVHNFTAPSCPIHSEPSITSAKSSTMGHPRSLGEHLTSQHPVLQQPWGWTAHQEGKLGQAATYSKNKYSGSTAKTSTASSEVQLSWTRQPSATGHWCSCCHLEPALQTLGFPDAESRLPAPRAELRSSSVPPLPRHRFLRKSQAFDTFYVYFGPTWQAGFHCLNSNAASKRLPQENWTLKGHTRRGCN